MKRSWLARHPVGFMALYSIFYLSVFHYLEANVPLRSILVHCRLDDLIPFCKYAVIPYFAWFVWIPFTLFYLLWKAPREDFWRLCLPLFSGMTIALACYAVLPTALDLRPYWVPGSDIFAQTVRFLYRTDTATNVCPSIHVFNSVTLLLAYYRSHIFDAPRRRWMRPAAAVLCISIVCSTVLLKQHSCIDVALGALLALALDSAFTALERSQLPQVRREHKILFSAAWDDLKCPPRCSGHNSRKNYFYFGFQKVCGLFGSLFSRESPSWESFLVQLENCRFSLRPQL